MLRKYISLKSLHIALIVRLLIVLLLFTLCRFVFYIFNTSLFPEITFTDFLIIMLAGLRFDLSAAVIVNSLYILMNILPLPGRKHRVYQGFAEGLFYVVNSIALLANCMDVPYFPFTLKRTTGDIFNYLAVDDGKDFFSLLPKYLIDFWYIALIWIALIVLMVFLYKRTKKGYFPTGNRLAYYLKHLALMCLFLFFGAFASRGGFQLRPVSIISAGEYTSAQNIPLVLNTPFTIIRTINRQQIVPVNYYSSEKQLSEVYSPVHHLSAPADSSCHLNVVVIILESFSREHSALMNRDMDGGTYKGFTPFLDSLAQEGLYCTSAFSNVKKSIEGIPAVLASLPNLMDSPYVTSAYGGNKIDGLPKLLRKYGYTSAFFHGGTNGTMQFDAFAAMAGFDKYFGRNEYNNESDYDGNWGIYDEPYLQYCATKMNGLQQPFCTAIFTLSSHHPYHIPAKYKGKFRKGAYEIHESIQYADYALKRFFGAASKMPWFRNTLFVLTADHSSPTFSRSYQNYVGNLAIPLVYYRPDGSLKGRYDKITQQLDVLPSVLQYLNYSGDFVAFGNSVFDSTADRFNICYFNNVYQLISEGHMLQFNGEKVMAVYDLQKDPLLLRNIAKDSASYRREEMFLKAIVQSYNTRMTGNKISMN